MKNVRLPLACLALLAVLVCAPSLRSAPDRAPALVPPSPAPLPSASFEAGGAAADALRAGDLQTACQEFEQRARRFPREQAELQLIAGLAAYEAGALDDAETRLAAAGPPSDPFHPSRRFEDWRLALLGARRAARRPRGARRLGPPGRHPARRSPLAAEAWLQAAGLSRRLDDPQGVLDRVAAAREAGISGAAGTDLEELALEAATSSATRRPAWPPRGACWSTPRSAGRPGEAIDHGFTPTAPAPIRPAPLAPIAVCCPPPSCTSGPRPCSPRNRSRRRSTPWTGCRPAIGISSGTCCAPGP